jgi:hypothetical protein
VIELIFGMPKALSSTAAPKNKQKEAQTDLIEANKPLFSPI